MLGRAPSLEERAPSLEGSTKMETMLFDLLRSEIAPHILKFAWMIGWSQYSGHVGVLAMVSTQGRRWQLAEAGRCQAAHSGLKLDYFDLQVH